jgi:hypothetical protein
MRSLRESWLLIIVGILLVVGTYEVTIKNRTFDQQTRKVALATRENAYADAAANRAACFVVAFRVVHQLNSFWAIYEADKARARLSPAGPDRLIAGLEATRLRQDQKDTAEDRVDVKYAADLPPFLASVVRKTNFRCDVVWQLPIGPRPPLPATSTR